MLSEHAPITDDSILFDLWAEVVGEPGFGRRTLWLIFIDEQGYPAELVVPIEDIPEAVDIEGARKLLAMVRHEFPRNTVAAMLSRPGSGRVRPTDRDWARAIDSLLTHQARRWPVHLATDDGLRVFAPDDLLASRSA